MTLENLGYYFLGLLVGISIGLWIMDLARDSEVKNLRWRIMELNWALRGARDEAGYCLDCGDRLQEVRPGKCQCNNPFCPSNGPEERD